MLSDIPFPPHLILMLLKTKIYPIYIRTSISILYYKFVIINVIIGMAEFLNSRLDVSVIFLNTSKGIICMYV